jgi:amino acid transporter
MNQSPPPELAKKLNATHVYFYALGSMFGAGIYSIIGSLAGLLGNGLWLSFVLALLLAALTGVVYAFLGARFPNAGGTASIVERAWSNPTLSKFIGLSVAFSGITSMGAGLHLMSQTLLKTLSLNISPLWFAVVLLIFLTFFVYIGIETSLKVNLFCTLVETFGLVLIISLGLFHWHKAAPLDFSASFQASDLTTQSFILFQAITLTFYSFIGFEDVINMTQEVIQPQKNVIKGLLFAMGTAAVCYIALAITAISVLSAQQLAQSQTPLLDVAVSLFHHHPFAKPLYAFITFCAIFNTALLNYMMGTRMFYGMAKQRWLPPFLGHLHPRFLTPTYSVFFLFAIVFILLLIGNFKILAETTVLLLLLSFISMHFAYLKLKKPHQLPLPSWIAWAGAGSGVILLLSKLYQTLLSENSMIRFAVGLTCLCTISILIYSTFKKHLLNKR